MPPLKNPVRYLPGVGPEMARRLARLGIQTVGDLLFHVPRTYRDRRSTTPIGSLRPESEASILATLWDVRLERRLRGRRDVAATARNESGALRIVWFNQPHVLRSLRPGERYFLSGTVQRYRGLELHNPEIEPDDPDSEHLNLARVVPLYDLTEGVSQRWLRARVRDALKAFPEVPEAVPGEWRRRFSLPTLAEALRQVHFPDRPEEVLHARRRLALEELLALQFSLQYARARHRDRRGAPSLRAGEASARRFCGSLPFSLTRSQAEALAAIEEDLDEAVPMRRLLLGDVGSGKTVLALAAAVRAAGAGRQTALLAPTSLLAEQHAQTAERLLGASGVSFALMTAATKAKERDRILVGSAAGEIPIVIGTHALLERDLRFRSLGLTVVDEQHRFGVRQRILLADKGSGALDSHLLVLTATPIPRSLAMTVYGDLDLSILRERPPGRLPVATSAVSGDDLDSLIRILAEETEQGGSAFVVYPVVEESEAGDLKAAAAMAEKLKGVDRLAQAGVALVHGRMKVAERRRSIERFRKGEARVLVATTVVEVGLDIPDATLIVIEHPERFGLAQLHQLRGRVGRAERPGRCVLLLGKRLGEAARRRLGIFRRIGDGMQLAEEDLKLRGPGELLGTSQHGFPSFKAVDLLNDRDLIEGARTLASELLERRTQEGLDAGLKGWIEAHFEGADRFLGSG